MNTMIMSMGVEDLLFTIQKCAHAHENAQLLISFEISGNFFLAAENDDLEETLDYDALSKHLEALTKGYSCQEADKLHALLEQGIRQFSPLISGGSIKTQLSCPAGFINHFSLL